VMPSIVTLNTVQGIGDIFWVYQKVAPYVDFINLRIMCTDDKNVIQRRSKEFCSMLPKVASVEFTKVRQADYARVCNGRYAIRSVIERNRSVVEYAVNKPLEEGVNLADIDPGSKLERFVDLHNVPIDAPQEDYLCVFVAGAKAGTVWPWHRWMLLIRQVARKLGTNNVTLIGAAWDAVVNTPMADALRKSGFKVDNRVNGAGLAATVDLIRRSRYFLGYQSGLNVLAENYNVPQFMVYFDKLRPMMYTWIKPDGYRTRFHAACFGDDVGAMVEDIEIGQQARRQARGDVAIPPQH
jgi:hypothetical protein